MNPTTKRTLLPLTVLSLVLLVGVIGCSKRGTVYGKVTYDGKPVTHGIITFHPEKGNGIPVDIVDGEYKAEKVPAGPVIVTVDTTLKRKEWKKLKEEVDKGNSGGMPTVVAKGKDAKVDTSSKPGMEEMGKRSKENWEKIKDMIDVPDKYADPKTSNKSYTITSGSQEINIELEKVDAPPPTKKK